MKRLSRISLALALGVILCVLCSLPTPATAACSSCILGGTSYWHCSNQDGITLWCYTETYENGNTLCVQGGICDVPTGGGCDEPGGPCDLPPKHHFGPTDEEARQAKVREIFAMPPSETRANLVLAYAKPEEIQAMCAKTHTCEFAYPGPDAVTAAKRYTWGQLKIKYQ